MLSEKLVNQLHLEQIGFSDYTNASGEDKETKVYKTKVTFLDEEIEVSVLSTKGDFSLVGMEFFENCRIVIERHLGVLEIIKTSVNF